MEVLQSNNWKRYSPKIIVVENLKHSNTISGYLNKKSYKLIEKTNLSEIYKLIL